MCINTKYNMSMIEKVLKYEATELSVIKCKDEIWFRGKTIVEILGYAIQCKAILDHVDYEDKRNCQNWCPNPNIMKRTPLKYKGSKTESLTNNQKTQFILMSLG